MPTVPTPSHTLDIADPRVRSLLAEPLQLSVWEVLRRFGRPASTPELMQAMQRSESTVQASIDALSGLRLVQSKVTGALPGMVRHEVVAEALLVAFDGSDPSRWPSSRVWQLGSRPRAARAWSPLLSTRVVQHSHSTTRSQSASTMGSSSS